MKKLVYTALCVFVFSCGEPAGIADTAESITVSDTVFTPAVKSDKNFEVIKTTGFYIWDVDADKKTLKKNPEVNTVISDAGLVIQGLNNQYPEINLKKLRIANGTIHLKIENSDYLTNQMGSTGAAQYLAQAVINLTSVEGIRNVQIDFKQGSHASPGVWSRKDFSDYIIVQ